METKKDLTKEEKAMKLYEAMETVLRQMEMSEWKRVIIQIIKTISATPEQEIPSIDVYWLTMLYDMFEKIEEAEIQEGRYETENVVCFYGINLYT